MNLNEYQSFIVNFYQERNWYQYSPFTRMNF